MVYLAEPTALSVYPAATAIASTVSVDVTEIGPVYFGGRSGGGGSVGGVVNGCAGSWVVDGHRLRHRVGARGRREPGRRGDAPDLVVGEHSFRLRKFAGDRIGRDRFGTRHLATRMQKQRAREAVLFLNFRGTRVRCFARPLCWTFLMLAG